MIGTRLQCIKYIESLPEGQYEVKEHRQKRSLNANAYHWVLVGKIAERMNLSNTEVHNQMIADYGQIDEDVKTIILRDDIEWKKLDNLHLRPTTATRVLDDGKLYRVYHVLRGSHTYDSREMAVLINGVIQEAQALDIETITPYEKQMMLERYGKEYEKKHNTAG